MNDELISVDWAGLKEELTRAGCFPMKNKVITAVKPGPRAGSAPAPSLLHGVTNGLYPPFRTDISKAGNLSCPIKSNHG